MALENIKKAIIALEQEMFAQKEIEKRSEWAKMYLTCFYYKSVEEFQLCKYPDSRLSLRIYAVLSERMLGKHDPFCQRALHQVAVKDLETSFAFQSQKRSTVNYSEEEMNMLKKTTYKAFEFTPDRLEKLSALIPEEDRCKEVIRTDKDENDNVDELSMSPANKNRNKSHMASFQSFM